MQKLHFKTFINAPVENVWNTMLEDATYREWTALFNPGSYYKGNWEENSKMLFLGPSPDGSGEGGMVARIKENRPYEYLSIEHLGMVMNGEEDTTSEKVKQWAGAHENYTFIKKDGGTELSIEMDSEDEYVEMFKNMWPEALKKLKEIAEGQQEVR